jgi:hypothetical protein
MCQLSAEIAASQNGSLGLVDVSLFGRSLCPSVDLFVSYVISRKYFKTISSFFMKDPIQYARHIICYFILRHHFCSLNSTDVFCFRKPT